MTTVINYYDTYHTPGRLFIQVIITDGQPKNGIDENSLPVCQFAEPLRERNIITIIIGVGSVWISEDGDGKVACLVTSPGFVTDVLNYTQFLQVDFNLCFF